MGFHVEELQHVIDAIPLGVHVVDPQGRIVDANRAWLINFGMTRQEIRGKMLKDVMRSMIFCDSGEGRKDSPWEFEEPAALETLRTKFPSRATFNQQQSEAIARPILDGKGNLIYVVTTVIDSARAKRSDDPAQFSTPRATKMLGNSKPIDYVRQLITQVAKSDATVLITGLTGTGKEVAASEIQQQSLRRNKPFVQINCAAIPENLMEAELFGYEKGSFTGALKSGKMGLFEYANGGTLFLDEIGEMPLALQPKLLRAIQERVVTRVGGVRAIPVDVRIIASTNRDLVRQVEEGKFREDLYYRLNVIPIHLPALRERGEDVILLGRSFLQEFNQKYRKQVVLEQNGWEVLLQYSWPGNVRELRNLMERLVVLSSDGVVYKDQVETFLFGGDAEEQESDNLSLPEATDRLQRKMIQEAMLVHRNTYRAADALGISQSTLIRKAKRLGVATSEG